MDKTVILRPLWTIAHGMRKIGLTRVVDALGRRLDAHLGGATLVVDGISIHCSTAGHVHYMRDIIEHDRDRYFRELLRAAITEGATVVEAGAHLGLITIEAARAAGARGHVHAFEPNPMVLPVLRENIAANGMESRITVYPVAASDTAGTHVFYLAGGGESSSLHAPDAYHESLEIMTARADDVLPSDITASVVKLDTEGHEVAALAGMERVLRDAAPRLTIFAECNHGMLRAAGTSSDELLARLRALGLDVQWIDDDARMCRPIDAGMREHEYVNLIGRRKE